MEGLEVQIVELQGDQRKLREQSNWSERDGRRKKRHYNRYKVLMASLVVLVRFNLFVYACV